MNPENLLSPNCSSYSNLSLCTEDIFDCLLMPWPNPYVEEIFVNIHTKFFRDCPTEELSDPPPAIVFALVITPICLIPVMVSLVVLKTKNGDGSSWKPPDLSVFRLQDNNYFKNLIALFLSQLGETRFVYTCTRLLNFHFIGDLHSLPALSTNSSTGSEWISHSAASLTSSIHFAHTIQKNATWILLYLGFW